MTRIARIDRRTAETQIELELSLDGSGQCDVASGIGFLDHMLTLFAKHSAMDLTAKAVGDLEIDQHHTVEDLGICLGQALKKALGDKSGIRRYGNFALPMDESLVTAAVDLGGRSYFVFNVHFPTEKIGDFDAQLIPEFWQAFTANAACNLHVNLLYGENSHHIAEAIFKAVARALRAAVGGDSRLTGVPSTKGTL